MDDLILRLSTGDHPVVAARAKGSADQLKQSIDRGFVLLQFTDMRGGTELGVRIDPAASDLSEADFAARRGCALLTGHLTLNDVKVRCVARLDLETLAGTGRLEVVAG